jgi:hypothetical protein
MINSRILHRIAVDPVARIRLITTGRLPGTVKPASPLIDLLERITPRDRALIRGLRVGPDLGYLGSRMFHTAEQALRWLKPHTEMIEGQIWPAESCRIKNFQRVLHIEQLLSFAASCPPGLAARYPRLRTPTR